MRESKPEHLNTWRTWRFHFFLLMLIPAQKSTFCMHFAQICIQWKQRDSNF